MKTNINEIKQPHYRDIAEKLKSLTYPCTIIIYGPARDYRTTYRREHAGCFGIEFCQSANDAWNLIDNCGYEGYLPDLKIYSYLGEVDQVY
jgi:hypothetical protein